MKLSYYKTYYRPYYKPFIEFKSSALPKYPVNFIDAQLSTSYTSTKFQPGIAGAVTITGGTFSIDGAEFGTTGTITDKSVLRLKVTSSDQYETAVSVVVSIDAVGYCTWTVTTMAEDVGIAAKYTNTDHYIGTENYE